MGEVISLERRVRRRRGAERSRLHATCTAIIRASVAHASAAVLVAPDRDRPIWIARLRKLEELATWAEAVE